MKTRIFVLVDLGSNTSRILSLEESIDVLLESHHISNKDAHNMLCESKDGRVFNIRENEYDGFPERLLTVIDAPSQLSDKESNNANNTDNTRVCPRHLQCFMEEIHH